MWLKWAAMRGRKVEDLDTEQSRNVHHARAIIKTSAFTLTEAGSHHQIFSKGGVV